MQFPAQVGSELWMHKWKGLAGCARNEWCNRLEGYGLCRYRKGGFSWPAFSRVLCPCSSVLYQVSLFPAVMQCWCTRDAVCAGLHGGNSSCGLMPEHLCCGAMAKAQAVLEPFVTCLLCWKRPSMGLSLLILKFANIIIIIIIVITVVV